MEWITSLKQAITYMEEHLLEEIEVQDVADEVHISPFYFQKGFKLMTGISISEYIRNRRLYLAALELCTKKERVIDLAYKYGYDSPESFTKAFTRFHGEAPVRISANPNKVRAFLPLKLSISISGGENIDFVVEQMDAMRMIGFKEKVDFDEAYRVIPKLWLVFKEKYCTGKKSIDYEIIDRCNVGEFGICLDAIGNGNEFEYMIAGIYESGLIPPEMEAIEIPALTWAKFKCIGPLPAALQSINTKVFKEWLPVNEKYELADGYSMEWYSSGDNKSDDFVCEIWVPVKERD